MGNETANLDSDDFWGFASVEYAPEDLTTPTPAVPTTTQDLSSSYYHVYNYQHFIYLVNKAIEAAWSNLKSKFVAGGGLPFFNRTTTIPPWIDFDTDTNRLYINADYTVFNSELWTNTPGINRMKLIFNDRLYELFASIPFRLVNKPLHLSQLQNYSGRNNPWYDIRFVNRYTNRFTQKIPDPLSTTTPQGTLSVDVITAHQEMTSVALWNPVAFIVFSSSLLPIIATQTTAPKNLGS